MSLTWHIAALLGASGGAGASPPAGALGRTLGGAAQWVTLVLFALGRAETVLGVLDTLCTNKIIAVVFEYRDGQNV